MPAAVTPPEPSISAVRGVNAVTGDADELSLRRRIDEVVNRRPAVGLAVGVVRDGRPVFFGLHGLADIESARPITAHTVFRIGSITKLFTAIAVMQLWEAGRVDLDAPAQEYLRSYRLVAANPVWRRITLRHLMTHTSGIPEVRGVGDLLHASLTPAGGRPATLSMPIGDSLPPLAQYYRNGLRNVVEPGTAFAYSNHGFATLGQIVEDVSGRPLWEYLAQCVLRPLGMTDSSLVRTAPSAASLATGYSLGRTGARRVADREWIDRGAGQLYATPRDMARFTSALLGRGANEHGRILQPATLAMMLQPQFQPDPRIPGIGLAFFRGQVGGRRTAGHDGILPGFTAGLLLAPDDGVGIFALTNTGGAFGWLQMELDRLMEELLPAAEGLKGPAAQHPEIWSELRGRYVFQPRIADLRNRLMVPGGAQVEVIGGRLVVRLLTPVPVPFRGVELEPDDADDAYAFRLDLSRYGVAPVHVVFERDGRGRTRAAPTDLGGQPWSLVRRADAGVASRSRWWAAGMALAAGAAATARRRSR